MTRQIKLIIRHTGIFHAKVKTDQDVCYKVFFTSIAQLVNFQAQHGVIVRYERI